jgi:hypothetical protein
MAHLKQAHSTAPVLSCSSGFVSRFVFGFVFEFVFGFGFGVVSGLPLGPWRALIVRLRPGGGAWAWTGEPVLRCLLPGPLALFLLLVLRLARLARLAFRRPLA